MFKPIIVQENTNILNEAYFGSKPVEKILNQLSIARKKYLTNDKLFQDKRYETDINTDPEVMKLNKLFEDTFGFKSFGLYVYNTAIINAYTISPGYRIDSGNLIDKLKSSSKGFSYDKKDNISCIVTIYSGMFCNADYTDREILAIILHEIGHNFTPAIDPITNAFYLPTRFVYYIITITDFILLLSNTDIYIKQLFSGTNFSLEAYNKLNEKINKNFPELKNAINFFTKYFKMFKDLYSDLMQAFHAIFVLSNPLGFTIKILYGVISNLNNIILLFPRHRDEKIADSFATMYGYGADLSSALNKFEKNNLIISGAITNSPIIGSIYNLCMIPTEFIAYLLDEHPTTIARINNQLDYCKSEFSNANLDPKLEREIQQNIRDLENLITRYNPKNNTNVFEDPMAIKRIYAYVMLKLCGGDIKELFNSNNNIYNTIDKAKKRTNIKLV